MYFAPRLLQVESEQEALREFLDLGLDPEQAHRLAAGTLQKIVRLSAVPASCLEGLRLISKTLDGLEVCQTSSGSPGEADLLVVGSLDQLGALVGLLETDPLFNGFAADLSNLLSGTPPQFLQGRSCRLKLDRPLIMGVINITPDSFFPGGRCADLDTALHQAAAMASQGADILDVGGESTRPGSPSVPEQVELDRVIPLIERLKREIDLPISVDTTKSRIAFEAVAAGAEFINDISGLRFDPAMAATAAQSGAGVFLMHTRGRPARMQEDTRYRDLVGEILLYLHEGCDLALSQGVSRDKLAIDPGIGFGKSVEGNLEIIRRLREFASLGLPILLGTSRKGFIGKILDRSDPGDRLFGTVATVALGVAGGAHIFRVHDVEPARDAALVAWAVRNGI